ncbi:MAG TPA: hypothetical protein VF216_03235 [Mizugakiibacter sp.]
MLWMKSRPWLAGSFFARMQARRKKPTKNPAQGRVFVGFDEERATAYPADIGGSGRRAREVMPAAMRALVRTQAVAGRWLMDIRG